MDVKDIIDTECLYRKKSADPMPPNRRQTAGGIWRIRPHWQAPLLLTNPSKPLQYVLVSLLQAHLITSRYPTWQQPHATPTI